MYFKRGKGEEEEEAGGGNGGLVMMEEVLEEYVEVAEIEDEGEEEEGGEAVVESNYHQKRSKDWYPTVGKLKEYVGTNGGQFPKRSEALGEFWHNTKNRMKKGDFSSIQLEKLQSIGVPVEDYVPNTD